MAHRLGKLLSSWIVVIAICSHPAFCDPRRDAAMPDRLSKIVEANIIAVHAYQIQLARSTGKGDRNCFDPGALSDAQLALIISHQKGLLQVPAATVGDWTHGTASDFDPSVDLEPILSSGLEIPKNAPVNVFTGYLAAQVLPRHRNRTRPARKAQPFELRAVANLYQTILEVDRDGDLLQQEFDLYKELGLPIYVGQFGLPGGDEDFLAAGRELAAQTCLAPFATDAPAWQIAGRKVWNWGVKKLQIRDERVLAHELLNEPDIAAEIPAMERVPAQKIAIIGHSFTMGQHWSSPSSFVPIVTAMFAKVNPKIEFRQFAAGGLTASRAYKNFYADALAWNPGRVLLVALMRSEEDLEALRTMGAGFAAAGARVCVFDNLHDPEATDQERNRLFLETAREAGIEIIPVEAVLANAPDREKFVCLDGIHMTEPYHRLMAREWLRFLLRPEVGVTIQVVPR